MNAKELIVKYGKETCQNAFPIVVARAKAAENRGETDFEITANLLLELQLEKQRLRGALEALLEEIDAEVRPGCLAPARKVLDEVPE